MNNVLDFELKRQVRMNGRSPFRANRRATAEAKRKSTLHLVEPAPRLIFMTAQLVGRRARYARAFRTDPRIIGLAMGRGRAGLLGRVLASAVFLDGITITSYVIVRET